MTCIVAVTDGTRVVIGGDSAATGGGQLRLRATRKVFRVGSYAVGYSTSYRMGQLVRFRTELPDPPHGADADDLERFMVAEFVEVLREALTAGGFAKTMRRVLDSGLTEEGQERGGLLLVGVGGQIFEIRQDYQVVRPMAQYSAIGVGDLVALGALRALEERDDLALQDRARLALEASAEYCSKVRGPFHFVECP